MSEPHVLPIKLYLGIFFTLLGLTALTTWVAYQDVGVFNTPAALIIAGIKATLVVLYFMHVRYSIRLIWLFSVAGIFWLLILFALTLSDYETRPNIPGWGG